MICTNQHGLFWAGDTAQVRVAIVHRSELTALQTISVGSSFRFADLKAYQYRIEVELSVLLDHAKADSLFRSSS